MFKKIRDDAAAAAAAIKAKNKSNQQQGLRPAFKMKLSDFSDQAIPPVTVLSKVETSGALWLTPFVLRNCGDVNLWLGDARLQEALTQYAVDYPKSIASESDSQSQGRHQIRIEEQAVMEVTKGLFDSLLCEQCDLSSVEGGTTFMSALWFQGFSEHGKMSYCGFTPDSSSTCKVLCLGKVNVIAIKTTSLCRVSSSTLGPSVENLDHLDTIWDWDRARILAMVKAGVEIVKLEQQKGDLLFIPQGWIVCEWTAEGTSLNYGVRKSFVIPEQAASQYEAAMKLYIASGRDVSRMQAIAKIIKAQ